MARRRILQMVVAVTMPADMREPAALAEVRSVLRNSDPGSLALFTVSPLPRDRKIKPRRPPSRTETPPLLAYMNGDR